MPKHILTAEELDLMWPNDATTEPEYEERMALIQDSLRELRNERSRVKTLEDAMDAFDALVAEAHKTKALGLEGQTSTLKANGRAGTGNTQWNYPANFGWAVWLIEDEKGEQSQRNSVLNGEYGMSLEDDYKPLVKAHEATLAVLRKAQADTKLNAQLEQAQRTYENDLNSIEGAD
jgi:hypothetical protein